MAVHEAIGFSYLFPWYQIACVLGILGVLLPFTSHLRAGNAATIFLSLWVLLGNSMALGNTIAWRGNLHNNVKAWCDISAAFFAVMGPGIATSTMAIQYKLWVVARSKTVFITAKDKRRHQIITWLLCLGFPLFLVFLHWICQSGRFDIVEDVGCLPTTNVTNLSVVIYYLWEPVFSILTAVFSILTVYLFLQKRSEFDAVLAPNISNVTQDRYIRLMCLSAAEVVIHTPLSLWLFVNTVTQYRIDPFYWSEYHNSRFGRIRLLPRLLVDASQLLRLTFNIAFWCIPAVGIIFFIFFGFGEEALRNYKWMFYLALRPFGVKPPVDHGSGVGQRRMVKSWLDVILCRPGRPTLVGSGATSSLPQFTNTGKSQNNPEDPELNINIENLDFLNPAAVRERRQAEAEAIRAAANANRRSSLAPSERETGTSVDKEKAETDLEAGPTTRTVERDPSLTEIISF